MSVPMAAATSSVAPVSATAAMPAVPARAATPTETSAPAISAPVEARAVPTGVVPAVIPAAEDELGLLNVTGCRGKAQAGCGQCRGRTSKSGCTQRKGSGKNEFLHVRESP